MRIQNDDGVNEVRARDLSTRARKHGHRVACRKSMRICTGAQVVVVVVVDRLHRQTTEQAQQHIRMRRLRRECVMRTQHAIHKHVLVLRAENH